MSLSDTALVRARALSVSSLGTLARITLPGLKPSKAANGLGSIATPLSLRGICDALKFRRRPVVFDLSFFVNESFGNGSSGVAACAGPANVSAVAARTAASAVARRGSLGAMARTLLGANAPKGLSGKLLARAR